MTKSAFALGLGVVVYVAAGCGGASGTSPDGGAVDAGLVDLGLVDGGGVDGGGVDGGGVDGGGGCQAVTLGAWRLDVLDDVSATYVAPIVELVDGDAYGLYLTFERYGDAEYVGTFVLAGSRDANRSTCAHCVMAFTGLAMDHGFFVESGTLTLASDPFGLVLDGSLRDLRLVEVTIGGDTLESTPVPGGLCLDVADVDVTQHFAPPGWTCPAAQYGDGTSCHCTCGLFDPDCDGTRPVADCAAGELCELRRDGPIGLTFCAPPCSRAAGMECAHGVCAVGVSQEEYCDPTAMLLADVPVGAACPGASIYCAPVGASFFDGICDVFVRNDGICRARCTTDGDCDASAGDTCMHLFGDPGIGLCTH